MSYVVKVRNSGEIILDDDRAAKLKAVLSQKTPPVYVSIDDSFIKTSEILAVIKQGGIKF